MSHLGDLWNDSKGNLIAVLCLVIVVFGFYGIYYFQVTRVPAPKVNWRPASSPPYSNPEKSRIRMAIQVDGLERSNSNCTISLYHDADQFNKVDNPLLRRTVTAIDGIVRWDVTDLETGRFAVAVYEDASGDGMQNKPEKVGYSNNPSVTLGLPKFEDVAVTVHAKNTVSVSIHLRSPVAELGK